MQIISDENAWSVLTLSRRVGDNSGVGCAEFGSWPLLHVKLEPGDGLATPEMACAVLLLRKSIHRSYALLKYGALDARLGPSDVASLKPKYWVEEGCTLLTVDVSNAAAEIGRFARGRYGVIKGTAYVAAWGLLMLSQVALAGWMNNIGEARIEEIRVAGQKELEFIRSAADIKKEELRLTAQKEHNAFVLALTDAHARMAALQKAYSDDESGALRFAASDLVPWRAAFLDLVPPGGKIVMNGNGLEAPAAKRAAKLARKSAKKAKSEWESTRQIPDTGWIAHVNFERVTLPPPMKLGRSA